MLINTFSDGTKETSLRFTSNGARKVVIEVPKNAIVKEALLELEAQELPDASVIRVGLVKNCSLADFNMLEERLEITSWGKNTVRPGWGTRETTTFLTGETGKYRVIPIDPASMIGAHPSFYRREFDVIVIPNGPFHADITGLLNSRVPIITMNPEVARKIGLCRKESLHGAITKVHIADPLHYISEQFRQEEIRIGGREDEQAEHILMDAIEPLDESVKGILDTGISSQSILVTSMDHKYAYIGFSRADQMLDESDLFTIFRRCMEWCGIGGYITNIGMDVCGMPGGFKKLGRLSDIVDTPDFADKVNEYISNNEPNEEGNYDLDMTFYSDSPGLLIVSDVRLDCVFLTTITTYAGEERSVELGFDSIRKVRSAYVDIPKVAEIKSATLKIEGDLSRERIAIISADQGDNYGVTVSTQYTVAQRFSPDKVLRIPRMELRLSRPGGDAEVEVEVREDHRGVPVDETLAASLIKGDDVKKKYSWVEVPFDNLVVKPDEKYWILLRVKKGKVHWQADKQSPLEGMLKFTKDGGKSWAEHEMDALFKVFYVMESYDESPTLSLLPSSGQVWGYKGEFRDVQKLPDFGESLAEYLRIHAREFSGQKVVSVPLSFSAQSIGTLRLYDLIIECELPTVEMKEEVETATIGKELKGILELLARIRNKVDTLIEGLPEEVLENLELEREKE